MSNLTAVRKIHPYLSETAMSNLYAMGVASPHSPNQAVGRHPYCYPSRDIRLLRAKLILEEALETIDALGFYALERNGDIVLETHGDAKQPDLEKIIDGCCDTIYVATGCLMSCGVPDIPHLNAVNAANDAKFPGGVGIFRDDGKYLKPDGWKAPVHLRLGVYDMASFVYEVSRELVEQEIAKGKS